MHIGMVDEEEDHVEAFGLVDSADFPEDMVEGVDETCEAELKVSFKAPTSTNTSHYFVDVDPSNPQEDDVDGLDWEGSRRSHSITQVLTLPTIATRATSRIRDPIVDFSKSIMFIEDSYLGTVVLTGIERWHSKGEREKTD